MGYTHYWTFKRTKGTADATEKAYQTAILECHRVIKAFYAQYGGLSGYSAHTKLGQKRQVKNPIKEMRIRSLRAV